MYCLYLKEQKRLNCFFIKSYYLNHLKTIRFSRKNEIHPLEIKFKKTYSKFRKIKNEFRKEKDKQEQKNL